MKKVLNHIVKNKTIYRRLMYAVALFGALIILVQCIECGFGENGFYFKWRPAATVNVNVNK